MKRLISLVLVILTCFCAFSAVAEQGESLKAALAQVEFTADETRAMSNFRNMSRYVTVDGVIYGRAWDEKIVRMVPEVGKKNKVSLTDTKILLKSVVPVWFCESAGDVFCYLDSFGDKGQEIVKIDLATDEITTLRSGEASYLFAHDGKLYFTNEAHQLCMMNTDGTGETVALDRKVFYPYFLADDILYFQDDTNGEKGVVVDLVSGEELVLIEERTYQTIVLGDTMYYLFCNAGEMVYHLGRVNLKTLENEKTDFCASQMFIEGNEIWFADDTHETPEDVWARTKDVKDYSNTRLSYLYSNGEFYIRYGWKNGTTAISNMKLLPVGDTKNAVELKVKK